MTRRLNSERPRTRDALASTRSLAAHLNATAHVQSFSRIGRVALLTGLRRLGRLWKLRALARSKRPRSEETAHACSGSGESAGRLFAVGWVFVVAIVYASVSPQAGTKPAPAAIPPWFAVSGAGGLYPCHRRRFVAVQGGPAAHCSASLAKEGWVGSHPRCSDLDSGSRPD